MKKLNTKKTLVIILAIFILSIVWRFSSILYFPDSSIILQKGEPVKVQPEESLTQKFVATRDGLSKMEILLRSPGVKFEDGDKVEMRILDADCQKVLRQGELETSFLSDNNLYEFRFKRFDDSRDKSYCLSATFLPEKKSAKALRLFTRDNSSDLSIRPAYKNASVREDLEELGKRISQYKPFFLKHYYLWFASVGFIALSSGLVVILIIL